MTYLQGLKGGDLPGSYLLVGAYTRNLNGSSPTPEDPAIVGFTYTGAVDGSSADGWRSVQGITQLGTPGTYTFVHSVDDLTGYFSLSSTAFIVDLETGLQTPIRYPGQRDPLVTHTAYGIWDNEDGTYTIAGGSGERLKRGNSRVDSGEAYLIDYDSVTGRFSNYTSFAYRNRDRTDLISHFEGIYRTKRGAYRLLATSVALNRKGDAAIASVVTVKRNKRDDFKPEANWRDLKVTRSSDGEASVISTANSQFRQVTVGFANYPDGNGGLTPLDFVAQPLLI